MLDNCIVVPYRNREKHLNYFIENTVPLLQKHIPNGKVVIVEQDWNNNLFNRGAILNIVFKEYENSTTHFMTHDVDINPTEDTIINRYIDNVEHNTIKSISVPGDSLGGIIKFSSKTIFDINGFPNDIWGWGAEDIVLQNRANYFNINIDINNHILHSDKNYDKYFLRFDDINDRVSCNNWPNICRYSLDNLSNDDKLAKIYSSGLNNLTYKIIERKDINSYVEIIKVSI